MPTSGRRPPALLPAATARLAGFAALALLGAGQWQRLVVVAELGRRAPVGARRRARRGRDPVGRRAEPLPRDRHDPRRARLARRRLRDLRAGARAAQAAPDRRARRRPVARRRGARQRPDALRGRRPVAGGDAAAARRVPVRARRAARVLAAGARPRLPVPRARPPARPRRLAGDLDGRQAARGARHRPDRAHGLLPVARAPAAAPGARHRGDARARPRGRAAARLGRRQGGAVVRLPRVRGGPRARRGAAVQLGPQLRADDVAARRLGGPARRHAARVLLEGRRPRRLRRRDVGRQPARPPGHGGARGRPGRGLGGAPGVAHVAARDAPADRDLRHHRHRHDARRDRLGWHGGAVGRAGAVALGQPAQGRRLLHGQGVRPAAERPAALGVVVGQRHAPERRPRPRHPGGQRRAADADRRRRRDRAAAPARRDPLPAVRAGGLGARAVRARSRRCRGPATATGR